MTRASYFTSVLLLVTVMASPIAAADNDGFAIRLLQGVLSNVGQIAQKSDTLFGNVSAEDEANMGRAAAAVLLGVAPPLQNPQLQAYLNRVGKWLVMQTERPTLNWRFAVLDDDTVNAFATPGGYIFVTRGLFMVLRNEAELAGILAHEIAHVLARHHVNALISKERSSVLLDILKDASGVQAGISDVLVAATKNMYASGLDQGDELEADLMGTIIASRAGYEPYALQHVLLTLEGIAPSSDALTFFVSTHPPFRTRIDAINDALSSELAAIGGELAARSLVRIQTGLRATAAR